MIAAVATTRALDAVVVVHAVVAIAALVVLVTLRSAATAAHRGAPLPATAARSFTGRHELAGRIVHLVPLSGLWAVSVSRGAYGLSTTFVVVGLAMWLLAAACLEGVAFPAQREVAAVLASSAGPTGVSRAPARRMVLGIDGALGAVVVAAIVMVAAQR